MKISDQTQFHTQAGGTAKAGEASTAGQTQEADKKTSASARGIRDSFERTNAVDPRSGIFGSATGRLGTSPTPIPEIGEMKNCDYEGDPDGYEDGMGKGFNPHQAAAWMQELNELQHRPMMTRMPDGRRNYDHRRDMVEAIEMLSEAEHAKAAELLTESGCESCTASPGAPDPNPHTIEIQQLPVVSGQDQPAGAGIGPTPGQGATLTGFGRSGGGGGGGGVGAPSGNSDGNTPGGFFGGGTSREPRSAHGHGPNSNRGGTPEGPGRPPAGPSTPSTPSDTSSQPDKRSSEGDDTGGQTKGTKNTMAVVDKLIASWDEPEPKAEEGEGLPPADETRPHGGGSDIGPHRPERLRGVTQQEIDLVGPAIAKKTGPDDKDRPETGSTSGRPATGDLDDDIGGPGISSLRKGGGGEAGPLWKDLRVLNPIDPSKV